VGREGEEKERGKRGGETGGGGGGEEEGWGMRIGVGVMKTASVHLRGNAGADAVDVIPSP